MSQVLKGYNIAAVMLNVHGYIISGYGEDGAIEFSREADMNEITVGVDGHAVSSLTSNNGVRVTLTMGEWTKGYRDLSIAMTTQEQLQKAGGPLVPAAFSMVDASNGDSVTAPYSVFTKKAVVSKGAKAGSRVFELYLADPIITYGLLNVI